MVLVHQGKKVIDWRRGFFRHFKPTSSYLQLLHFCSLSLSLNPPFLYHLLSILPLSGTDFAFSFSILSGRTLNCPYCEGHRPASSDLRIYLLFSRRSIEKTRHHASQEAAGAEEEDAEDRGGQGLSPDCGLWVF